MSSWRSVLRFNFYSVCILSNIFYFSESVFNLKDVNVYHPLKSAVKTNSWFLFIHRNFFICLCVFCPEQIKKSVFSCSWLMLTNSLEETHFCWHQILWLFIRISMKMNNDSHFYCLKYWYQYWSSGVKTFWRTCSWKGQFTKFTHLTLNYVWVHVFFYFTVSMLWSSKSSYSIFLTGSFNSVAWVYTVFLENCSFILYVYFIFIWNKGFVQLYILYSMTSFYFTFKQ